LTKPLKLDSWITYKLCDNYPKANVGFEAEKEFEGEMSPRFQSNHALPAPFVRIKDAAETGVP
jgi:hypothetical protein